MMRADLFRAAVVCLIVAGVSLWLLLVTGCGPVVRNTGVEKGAAPTSNLTRDQAIGAAHVMCVLDPSLQWSEVQPTGSMEPLINSHSIIVWEPSDGSDLRLHQIVIFRSGADYVLHRVVALNATHVTTDGVSNRTSDGWQPRDSVVGRLVAVIYADLPHPGK